MSAVHLRSNNLDFSEDVLHFADLGFKQMSDGAGCRTG